MPRSKLPDDPMKVVPRCNSRAMGSFSICLLSSIALSTAAPKELWQVPLDGGVFGAPTVAKDGTVYVGTVHQIVDILGDNVRYGKLYSLSPTGTTNWVRDLGGPPYSTIALADDGTVYA